jgi:hypothetical protein
MPPTKARGERGAMATKKTGKANGKSTNDTSAAIQEALTHLIAASAALAKLGPVAYTSAQRITSNGKLRDGEADVMNGILDTVDAFHAVFSSIADKDGGIDDAKVETGPARAHIALWSALAPVAAKIDEIQTAIADKMLHEASSAKDVTLPAYAIIRANAPANAKLAKAGQRAMSFYGHPAKQRAANAAKKARAEKKAKPATAT